MKKAIYLITLVFVIVGCNNKKAPSPKNPEPDAPFFDTYWQLAELEGKPVVVDRNFNREPYLIFTEDEHKVEGNAGCNQFGGILELAEPGSIKISLTFRTQINCPNLKLEHRFLEVLSKVNRYKIIRDTLILGFDRVSPLAKLGKVLK